MAVLATIVAMVEQGGSWRDWIARILIPLFFFCATAPTLRWVEFAGGAENIVVATALEIAGYGRLFELTWPMFVNNFGTHIPREHLGAARFGHLEVERTGQVQRLDIVHPSERHVVVGPASFDRDRDLVGSGAVERPVVHRGESLDDVDRIAFALGVEFHQ